MKDSHPTVRCPLRLRSPISWPRFLTGLRNGDQLFEEESEESSSSMGLAISKLNRSLTLDIGGEDSGVRVLGASLSQMCFNAPQVFDSEIEYLVRTIGTEEMIEISKDIIDKLGADGRLASQVFQAVVRSAASTSCSEDGRNKAVSKLLAYLPRESSIENHQIPLRFDLAIKIIGGDHRLKNYSSIVTVHLEIIEGRAGTMVIESFVLDVPQ